MKTDRRAFIGAALGLSVVAGLLRMTPSVVPTLVGDGVADDTEALQYLINQSAVGGPPVELSNRWFRISKTLFIPKDARVCMSGCTFNCSGMSRSALDMPHLRS